MLANTRDLVGTLDSLIRRHAGEFLDAVDFVGTYDKPPIPEGKKSVTFRITVASREKTLSSAEVNVIREGIVNGLRESGYELRG